MNKWSTSLPSMISLCNDVQFDFDPMFMQPSSTTTPSASPLQGNLPHNSGSMTDLSILIQTQPSLMTYDRYMNSYSQSIKQTTSFYDTSIEHQTAIQTNHTPHEQYVPDDKLLQSLVAYADSFELDSSVYSIPNPKQSPTLTAERRRRTQSTTTHLTSVIENDPLIRHKSCDDLSIVCSIESTSSKPATVVERDENQTKTNSTKFVPSESHPQFLFAAKQNHNNNNNNNNNLIERNQKEKAIEDGLTTTNGSKLEWHFSSDTITEFNKHENEIFNNYEASTNIGDINVNYLKDLERFSALTASMNFSPEISAAVPPPPPPPPVIIRKKSKDFLLKQKVDIQLLRPPTPPPPAPIIIREIRHKPPPSSKLPTIHKKLENTSQIRISKTPPPIVLRERPPLRPKQEFPSKPTIIYRRLPAPPPSPPTVIVERLRPNVSAVIHKPPPILIEKWLPYPPEQQRPVIYERASPLPKRNSNHSNDQGKKIIFEYDKVNVIVNKDIQQRKEIKRVSPNDYVQQYGNSFCSNETLQKILSNRTSSSQTKNERPTSLNQHYYENYSPMFH